MLAGNQNGLRRLRALFALNLSARIVALLTRTRTTNRARVPRNKYVLVYHCCSLSELRFFIHKGNIFDVLPSLAAPKRSQLRDDLDRFLASDPEDVKDPLKYWYEMKSTYPNLAPMALDYHSIPATSVAVERLFSRGRLILPHVRNGLSTDSIRALLCLGSWSLLGLVRDEDVLSIARLPDASHEVEMESGWDKIKINVQ
jgi:hypothetical protein